MKTVVKFGAGVDSTAMLCLMVQRREKPDAILFCDTGSERPETYAHLPVVDRYLALHDFPPITTIRWEGPHKSLEAACLKNHCLPSQAYGYKGCTVKWKIQPTEKWVKAQWGADADVRYYIGYDVSETRRWKKQRKGFIYPLVKAGMDRKACIGLIMASGMPVPCKSSCFFCPSMKKWEIVLLAQRHPELFQRALELEENARLTKVKGLGRSWSWREFAIEAGL